MTDIAHIDVDSEEFESAPKALRDHVKKLQKQVSDLAAERDGFRNQVNESALSGVLAGFKNPAVVRNAILGDKVDPLDTEAVTKWLESNGDDYARATEAPANPVEDQTTEQAFDPRAVQQERLNALQQFAQPGSANDLAVIQAMPTDLSPTQAREWLIQHGA